MAGYQDTLNDNDEGIRQRTAVFNHEFHDYWKVCSELTTMPSMDEKLQDG
jgi:hypothetical protein